MTPFTQNVRKRDLSGVPDTDLRLPEDGDREPRGTSGYGHCLECAGFTSVCIRQISNRALYCSFIIPQNAINKMLT